MSTLTRGDNHVLAVSRALARSEQILTGALLTDSSYDYDRYMRDVSAIATEWGFDEDLRRAVYDAAIENVAPQ